MKFLSVFCPIDDHQSHVNFIYNFLKTNATIKFKLPKKGKNEIVEYILVTKDTRAAKKNLKLNYDVEY